MCININLSNIIEWLIAIFLGIGGWYVANRSTLKQQKQERYNNLVQDFHQFISDFQLNVLPNMINQNNDKYVIQRINNYLKFIYWKARDIDSLNHALEKKIYTPIKKVGEDFVDAALLDPNIESALLASSGNKQLAVYKNKFVQLANEFIEKCYEISKFN
ncbi:hypothetical protein FACS1894163_04540 [Spirochaetia bacterium]|nr:hypothetical protein FACS1894163_04540 [Spirochaetia bacterium]